MPFSRLPTQSTLDARAISNAKGGAAPESVASDVTDCISGMRTTREAAVDWNRILVSSRQRLRC